MASYTVSVCDRCKAEQRSDSSDGWDSRHGGAVVRVGEDGMNVFPPCDGKGVTLCRQCRCALVRWFVRFMRMEER